ncbi:MAG: hypothetical protein COS87_02255 [Chloroflexi bacterium CG07_land_8_20_14_0_80_45_17]|nr:MAG: hypothetical protein COX14_05485 [Chloroflexi bacterium CG23_combo_of_CG06-09_8_20_14_all_45_10]PIU56395.1 MAG: hypothetical protein COS87_02255 [Chloroflexi bacterium CG07_land_8_20_14_0_80_45_17]
MKVSKIKEEAIVSRRLVVLLDELSQELQNTVELLAQLKVKGLTQEQVELILGELSAAISHLHEHTDGLDELIMDEINRFQ